MMVSHHSHADTDLIRKGIIGTGFIMLVVGIAAGIQFYLSMGGNGFESTVYIAAGVCIAFVTVLLLPVAIISWSNGHVIRSIIMATLWLALMSLQIFAEFGFFAESQDRLESIKNVGSIGYGAAKARLDAANAKLEAMSSNAGVDVVGLTTKLDALKTRKLEASKQLAKCKKGFNANCKDPLKAEIANLSEEITKIEKTLGSSQGYQGILFERTEALKDLERVAKTNGVATSNIAPVWVYAEKLFEKPARTIQVYVLVFIAVMIELWGSVSAYLLMAGIGTYKRNELESHIPQTAPKNVTPEPQQLTVEPKKDEPKKFAYQSSSFSPPAVNVVWDNSPQPAVKKS